MRRYSDGKRLLQEGYANARKAVWVMCGALSSLEGARGAIVLRGSAGAIAYRIPKQR